VNILENVPIVGITGVNGAGKTLVAAAAAIDEMERGRTVYSTVPVRFGDLETRPIRSIRELLSLEDCTVLLDEIAVIFSSRSSQSLPPDVVAWIHTLRHSKITLWWTAPAWSRCDNLIREVTQGVVSVNPWFRKRERGNPWPRPRLVQLGLLDTTTGKTDSTPTKVLRRQFVVPTRLRSWGAYDTFADTPLLGRHLQGGTCVDCGGTRVRPKHSEELHDLLGIPYYPEDDLAGFIPAKADPVPVHFEEIPAATGLEVSA